MRVMFSAMHAKRIDMELDVIPRVGDVVGLTDGMDYVVTQVFWDLTTPGAENHVVYVRMKFKD